MSMGSKIKLTKNTPNSIILDVLYKQLFEQASSHTERDKVFKICTDGDLKALSYLHQNKTEEFINDNKNNQDFSDKLFEYTQFTESLILEKIDRLRNEINSKGHLDIYNINILCDFEKRMILDNEQQKENSFSYIQPNEPEDKIILKSIEKTTNTEKFM